MGLVPIAVRASQLGVLHLCTSPACLLQADWVLCLLAISVNYLMHGFIWTRPSEFAAACKRSPLKGLGDHPVDVFAKLEIVVKLIQGAAVLAFLGRTGCSAAMGAL